MKTAYKLFWLAIIGFLITGGCFPKVKIPATPEPRRDSFAAAESMFHGKSYQKALSLYNEYLSIKPDGPDAPKAVLRVGEIYMTFYKDYPTARGHYKFLMDRYPDSPLVWDAKADVSASYYHEKLFKDAIHSSEEWLSASPPPKYASRLKVIIGDSYQEMNQPEQAVISYAAAHDTAESQTASAIEEKIRSSIQQLSKQQISSLLGTIQNQYTRGYLLYYMSQLFEKENKPDAAQRVLTQLHSQFPENQFSSGFKPSGERTSVIESSIETKRMVGVLLPLTGDYQSYGKRVHRGIEFAMLQFGITNHSIGIHLLIKDTESNEDAASQRLRELADENAMVIIGPVSTAETAAFEAQRIGIPIIMLTQKEKITDIGDVVFRHFITPELQVKSLMNYLTTTRGFTRFGILYPNEPYGENFMNLFWQESLARNTQVVASESYSPKTTDFRDPIRRIKRASEGIGIDALFLPEGVKKSAMIIPQLTYYDLKNVVLVGTNLWNSPLLIKMAGSYVQGAIVPDIFFSQSKDEQVKNFVNTFRDTYGEAPEFLEAIGYDSAMMVFQILSQPENQTRSDVKQSLMQLTRYEGVTGTTSFGPNRDAQKQLHILEVKGSNFTEIGRY